MLPSHDRFEYSPITGRPDFTWPGGRRLAVYIAVCVEHFPYGEGGLGIPYSPGLEHPNTYNWAWREYGNRVGGFRLVDLLAANAVRPTVLLNTECYEHCPELVAAFRAAGSEFVGHGATNARQPNAMDEPAERAVVQEVYDAIERNEGRPPGGWMSPGANPSRVTEDLLAETGYRYTLDWPMDDQPTWLGTRGGPLLSVPYPHEVNDVPMIVFHHGSSQAFADMTIDTIDEMLEQSVEQPLVCGITVHTFIVGQPFRLRRFRAALEHLAGLQDRIWLATAGEIAEHYAAIVPPPAAAPAGAAAGPEEARVAIAGLGAIGLELARRLSEGVPGYRLTAVAARDRDRAAATLRESGVDVPVVAIEELEPLADIVIECAPAALLAAIAEPVLGAGKEVVVLSVGALLDQPGLIELAVATGGKITVPTGALLGLDAVLAAAEGGIESVRLTTRKPPRGLAGAPHLEGLSLDDLREPIRVFSGTARAAAKGFPANLNVAVALALAGIGPDRTEVEIWADPAVTRNTHTIELRSSVADLTMTIENVPSENPKTGRITALSVISLLRKRTAPLSVGS